MSLRARTGRAALLRRTMRWGARGIGVSLLALGLVVGYFWLSTELPAPEHLRARAALGSTRILDRRGQLLYELPDPFSGRQRPIPLSEIPPALRQATIAIEDASFYGNPGVDLRGIARALWLDLRSGSLVAGGSTITQQLARGFLLDPQLAQQRSLERKLREAVLALKLTANYSKDEILALYLNQTYYGGMVVRRRGGGATLFQQARARLGPGRVCPAGGPAAGALALQPAGRSPGRAGAPGAGAGRDGARRPAHARAGRRREG